MTCILKLFFVLYISSFLPKSGFCCYCLFIWFFWSSYYPGFPWLPCDPKSSGISVLLKTSGLGLVRDMMTRGSVNVAARSTCHKLGDRMPECPWLLPRQGLGEGTAVSPSFLSFHLRLSPSWMQTQGKNL